MSFRRRDWRRQRGRGMLEDFSKSRVTRTNQIRARWNQQRADTHRRLQNETAKWREGARHLQWKLENPNPSLRERVMEKGRQTQFKAKHAFQPGIQRPKLNAGTKRALVAGAMGGVLAPLAGSLIAKAIKKKKKKTS